LLVWWPRQEKTTKLFKVLSHDSSWQKPEEQMACFCSTIAEGVHYSTRKKERSSLRNTHDAVRHFDLECPLHNPEKLIMVGMKVLRWSESRRHDFHP